MPKLTTEQASNMGKIGGSKSKGGGRKPLELEDMTPEQIKRRQRYLRDKKKGKTNGTDIA